MKKIMSFCICFSIIGIVGLTQRISAAEVQLKRFKAGGIIYADDVNGNFQALADMVKKLEQRVAELETHNRALHAEIATLKKQPLAPVPTSTPQPATQTSSTKMPKYSLRNTPKTVSDPEAQQVFGLDQNMRPLQYLENDFEVKNNIVIDHATGLIWQQSGPTQELTYQEAQQYVQQLNQERFAGYTDWRLPTVEELLSLVEKTQQTNGLYLNPIFDSAQRWCWSADNQSSESAWNVFFSSGFVGWDAGGSHVRCVRPGQ